MNHMLSTHLKDPHACLDALTVLKTQILGFVTAKGNERAVISTKPEKEPQGIGHSSYEAITELEEKEDKRQGMFGIYGRKFVE